MNIRSLLSLIFLATLFFSSCKKELEPQDNSSAITSEEAIANAAAVNPTSDPVPEISPAQVSPVPVNSPQQMVQAAPAKISSGMNPPHGQPNHRCDIAVGAPLNSPRGKQPAAPKPVAPATVTPTVTETAPAILNDTPVVTAPGTNPPHGQEGHRCDIAVGAALPKPE